MHGSIVIAVTKYRTIWTSRSSLFLTPTTITYLVFYHDLLIAKLQLHRLQNYADGMYVSKGMLHGYHKNYLKEKKNEKIEQQ